MSDSNDCNIFKNGDQYFLNDNKFVEIFLRGVYLERLESDDSFIAEESSVKFLKNSKIVTELKNDLEIKVTYSKRKTIIRVFTDETEVTTAALKFMINSYSISNNRPGKKAESRIVDFIFIADFDLYEKKNPFTLLMCKRKINL